MQAVTYTTTTVVFESDSTTIDMFAEQTVPVGIDDDGQPVVVFNEYGSIGYAEPAPVNKPLPPEFNFGRCSGTYAFDGNTQAYITSLTVSWEPAEQVDHYKVFCVVDSSNSAILTQDLNIGGDASSGYTTGRLFQHQSEKILPNIKFYKVDLSEFTYPSRVNVFVFAYNSVGRSDFPSYMITVRAKDKNYELLAKMYLEKTTYLPEGYPHDPEAYLYFLDDTLAKSNLSNVSEKDLTYQEPAIYLPE
jgi:hypothetical protein